jgi:hypothetical protein
MSHRDDLSDQMPWMDNNSPVYEIVLEYLSHGSTTWTAWGNLHVPIQANDPDCPYWYNQFSNNIYENGGANGAPAGEC